jgi:hypothetical protein
MDDEVRDAIVTVYGPGEKLPYQTPDEHLGSLMTAAINDGVAMDPVHAAEALRKYLAHHDADLIEQLVGTIPPSNLYAYDCIKRDDLLAEAARRRALA